jgi:hypothetical protein
MPRTRDYRKEYQRRVARALELGLSPTQARGHPKANEKSLKAARREFDRRFETAVLAMNRGESLTAATRRAGLSRKLFTPLASKRRLIKRKGRRWVVNDKRMKRVLVASRGRLQKIWVDNYEDASLAGSHYSAIGNFVRDNDVSRLEPFEGLFVRAANGKRFPLETDPNELHRIAAMDSPPFHEIYEITSNH